MGILLIFDDETHYLSLGRYTQINLNMPWRTGGIGGALDTWSDFFEICARRRIFGPSALAHTNGLNNHIVCICDSDFEET